MRFEGYAVKKINSSVYLQYKKEKKNLVNKVYLIKNKYNLCVGCRYIKQKIIFTRN